jgi:hypothetical protein
MKFTKTIRDNTTETKIKSELMLLIDNIPLISCTYYKDLRLYVDCYYWGYESLRAEYTSYKRCIRKSILEIKLTREKNTKTI